MKVIGFVRLHHGFVDCDFYLSDDKFCLHSTKNTVTIQFHDFFPTCVHTLCTYNFLA